jgi:hypothetical protein
MSINQGQRQRIAQEKDDVGDQRFVRVGFR